MINVFILFILIGNININKLRYVNSITYFLGSSSYINCLNMGQSAHSFKARLESDENRVKICLWLWCSSVEWHELRGGPDQGNRWSALEAFSLLILSPWACPRTGAQLKNLLSDIHQRWINSAHRSVLSAIFPPSIPLISLYNYRLNVFSCLTFWRGWKVAVKTGSMGEISQGWPAAKWGKAKIKRTHDILMYDFCACSRHVLFSALLTEQSKTLQNYQMWANGGGVKKSVGSFSIFNNKNWPKDKRQENCLQSWS